VKRLLTALALVIAGAGAADAEPAAEKLTLEQAMARAAQRPRALAAGDRARAAREAAVAERRAALFPTVSIEGGFLLRDRQLTLATPVGELDIADHDALSARAVVRQPILDPARLLYLAPARDREAGAAVAAARRSRGEAAGEAADRFFAVAAAGEAAAAARALAERLESRAGEIAALAAEGRALERDVLRLELAAADARQAERAYTARRRVAARALAVAVGADGAIEPVFDLERAPPPPDPDLAARALASRGDLAAIEESRQAAQLRGRAVGAEWIPSIDLAGGWFYDQNAFSDQKQFFQVAVNLTWRPLVAGTRGPRIRAARAEASARHREGIEARRGVAVAIEAGMADLEIARDAVRVAERGVDEAIESRRVTLERYRAGRETISDLIEAETLVADRASRRRAALIELWRARALLDVTAGAHDR
jgi:outer membrane protein TolC